MAQIHPIDIVGPGRFGLNTEKENTLLPPEWATLATNAVINRAGRLGARKGWADQTTNAIASTPTIDVLHEYVQEDSTKFVITAAGNLIFKGISDYTDAANDITSSTAPTADHWQFVNFNNKVLGFQKGHAPIEWSGSGDFTDAIYTGTGPDGNCASASFGRVWAADADLQTIRYTALLDDTDYSTGSGGGTINMRNVWTNGTDEIVAIAAVGANLVVFGRNHIVLWADGSGSEIGITPSQLEVVDTIEGTGCIARDSVVATGEGDLIFLSKTGLQSLTRVIQSKSNPTVILTKNIRSEFQTVIAAEIAADAKLDAVRAVHSPSEGLYVINFPSEAVQYVLDTNHPFQDEEGDVVFPITKWVIGGAPAAMLVRDNGDFLLGSAGVVGKYSGTLDNADTFTLQFDTGWLNFGEQLNHRLKIMKDLIGLVTIGGEGTVKWQWYFDFVDTANFVSFTYSAVSSAEFNVAEFNIAEWGGGVTLQRRSFPAHGEGQFIKLGVEVVINGFDVVIQQISIAPKIGRQVN